MIHLEGNWEYVQSREVGIRKNPWPPVKQHIVFWAGICPPPSTTYEIHLGGLLFYGIHWIHVDLWWIPFPLGFFGWWLACNSSLTPTSWRVGSTFVRLHAQQAQAIRAAQQAMAQVTWRTWIWPGWRLCLPPLFPVKTKIKMWYQLWRWRGELASSISGGSRRVPNMTGWRFNKNQSCTRMYLYVHMPPWQVIKRDTHLLGPSRSWRFSSLIPERREFPD